MTSSSTSTTNPNKILIVSSDLPSHTYACVKLATVLAEEHDVTVAGPNGMALRRLQAETNKYNASALTKRTIECISIGDVSRPCLAAQRPVVNPQDYSPLQIIFDTVFNREYNPFCIANQFEQLMDDQVDTYENIRRILPNYDLVYAIHTAAGTVCDATESLNQEQAESVPPCIVFSSLPYNSGFFYKSLWKTPRSIVALPHVATYSSPSKVLQESSFFLVGLVSYLIQLFWMLLDSYHAERAWKIAGKRTDIRRSGRGLTHVHDGMRYYWMNYPVLTFGGTQPFIAQGEPIADNATVVGSIRSAETSDLSRLEDWIERANVSKIVYASFGTGTQLSFAEATNLAKLAISLENTEYHLLLSLPKGSQERLLKVFDREICSKPTKFGDGFLEYKGGAFRIDNNVPQENLLLSNRVEVFISHMGFGGYAEAVHGGVPFVAYPAGCDQWSNAERAVEAGIAVKAKPLMENLDITVQDTINNKPMRKRSHQLAFNSANFDSNKIILDMVDEFCGGPALLKGSDSTVSTCSTSSTSASD